jgi:hypothetical protein
MKFFISGQIDDAKNVRSMMDIVVGAGHEITHDWTDVDVFLGGAQDKLNNLEESGLRAQKDIQGVVDSDVYILSSDNANVGKGMYVELGAALALRNYTGKPEIYVVGEQNHLSVFYLHPAVKRVSGIEDVLQSISNSPLNTSTNPSQKNYQK